MLLARNHHLQQVCHRALSAQNKRGYDVVVVGGGIVGCATARQLLIDRPELRIAVIEKEDHLAPHQSGNNSGVIHAGIYYTPGSLKAKLCVEGMKLAYDFFDRRKFPYKKTGKLIVAVEPIEVERLNALYKRGLENGVRDLKLIDGDQIKDYEPHCKGLKAIWSPHTGIVDWGAVTKEYAKDFREQGGEVMLSYPLKSFSENDDPEFPLRLNSNGGNSIVARYVITCAGLHSDRVAKLSGCSSDPKIVPFRGEYLLLKPEKRHLVKSNIYPVPDPQFPFLGVHFTPRMNGDVWLGPNAVLAYKREGYSYFSVSPKDLAESLAYSGMRKLVSKYLNYGVKEFYRGVFIRAQVKQLQRYVPDLKFSDVQRGPAGVRAQAMDSNGNLVDDFVFDEGQGSFQGQILHVRNAPSPGATSSLSIAKMIVEKATNLFKL